MSVRRLADVAGVVGTALLAAALGLQLAPAQAATPAVAKAFYDASGFLYPIGTCPATNNPGWYPDALPADGAWHTTTGTEQGTYAGTNWRRTATSKARITRNARGLARVDLQATSTSRVDPVGGSQTCSFDNEVAGSVSLDLTVPARSWLVLRSRIVSQSCTGQAFGRAGVSQYPDPFVLFVNANGAATRLVPRGTYSLTLDGGARTHVPARSTATRAHRSTVGSSVAFYPIGTLRSRAGNGLPYLTPGHRDCTRRQVKVAFSNAARTKVRSITFAVDGQRRFTLRGRQLNRAAVTLADVAPRKAGAVRADIVLKTGARRTMTATSWPCA